MKLPLYQVDAFTRRTFGGNPAAVVPLAAWIPETAMQAIATENNLSETAFFVAKGAHYEIRWFTPVAEIDLAGHPTLATAWVMKERLGVSGPIMFKTRLGDTLTVTPGPDGRLAMDFPARPAKETPIGDVDSALGAVPLAVLLARDGMAVFDAAETVAGLAPDLAKVAALDGMGLIVTAPGRDCDFVSRFFAPKHAVAEDPVTGSAHCTLIPYWAGRLGKTELFARQISARGGEIWCRLRGDRVEISGHCAPYLEGTIAF
jgi:predicted PhzF superfamily epimerase YddE/YHI9